MPSPKMTAPKVRSMKGSAQKIVCLTAYDASMGALADEAGVDMVLVGDSLGNVILGMPSTLPVSLEDMIHHTRATRQGVKQALLVADMPFGSYQSGTAMAVDSAIALVKAGAEAVKLEGAYVEQIEEIVKAGIPVMGHVGMTPQSVNNFGGFKMQGKGENSRAVLEAARAVDEAGAFSIVLELIPDELASDITETISCPSIGIGAGPYCDGQVQVFHDIVGLSPMKLRHAKAYCDGLQIFKNAISEFADETRRSLFPASEEAESRSTKVS